MWMFLLIACSGGPELEKPHDPPDWPTGNHQDDATPAPAEPGAPAPQADPAAVPADPAAVPEAQKDTDTRGR